MRKLSANKMLIIVVIAVLLIPAVRADATMGNINSFIYSSDYFNNEYSKVNHIAQCFRNKGISAVMTERPKSVYGLQQYFKNSESVYISTHGIADGSVLVLDGTDVSPTLIFNASDVPKSMECKLAYLSACYSAKTNISTRKNLCSTLISNGYKVVVGYTESVSNTVSKEFEREFYSRLSKGESVYSSLVGAKNYIRDNYNNFYDGFLNSVGAFGNQGLTWE